MQILSQSRKTTIQLGIKIAKHLCPGDILCLFGTLGSGKTTFVKGLAQGLHIDQDLIHSPTFVLLNHYKGRLPLFHFDLYRLEEFKEILNIGYEEFFYGPGVSVVEWAEKLKNLLPSDYLKVEFVHKKMDQRLIKITGHGTRFKKMVTALKKEFKV